MENPNGIYIGNLSFFSTEKSITEFLAECGTITRLFLPRDAEGKNKGQVFFLRELRLLLPPQE